MATERSGLLSVGRDRLEELYATYNRREFVHPDPLEFLYEHEDPRDREIAGLIASSLAYGRVTQILRSVSKVLALMPSPLASLMKARPGTLRRALSGFKHRFTTGEELVRLLIGAKNAIRRHGSLQSCFMAGLGDHDETILPALCAFTSELSPGGRWWRNSLLPSPAEGSACKRLNLFLRWMVRHDEVDPGGWDGVPASKLIVPLDTHMHKMGLAMGLTRRKQANMRTAMEVTAAFREIAPLDPVRYDFVLTRLGIREDLEPGAWLADVSSRRPRRAYGAVQ